MVYRDSGDSADLSRISRIFFKQLSKLNPKTAHENLCTDGLTQLLNRVVSMTATIADLVEVAAYTC